MRTGFIPILFVLITLAISPPPSNGGASSPFVSHAALHQAIPHSSPESSQQSQQQYSTDPVNITQVYSTAPAPVGIADYGVESAGGSARAYKIALSSVTGTALLHNISAASVFGASLQLNVVLRANTTSATYVYWLQNTITLRTNVNQAFFVDNIWNLTAPSASLNPTHISGTSGSLNSSAGPNFYAANSRFFNYSLPIGLTVPISVGHSGSTISVNFAYATAHGSVPLSTQTSTYDIVTISEPNMVTGAAILVDGYEMTPGIQSGRLTYFDAEFVFGGDCCLHSTAFTSMNSTIAMSYTFENGTTVAPLSLYEFGETGETVSNLAVTRTDLLQGFQFRVGLGRTNFSANYERQTQPVEPLVASYSVSGESIQNVTVSLEYISNGTEQFTTLGANPMTFRADARTAWQITMSGLTSNSTERWAARQTSGVVSGPQTISVVYYRQFSIHLGFRIVGGGTGYSAPTVMYTQFGSSSAVLADSSVWIDAGTPYSYPNQLTGSTSSERWISNDTSRVISEPGIVETSYQHQYRVTIVAADGGSVSYGLGSMSGTVSPGTSQSFYVPAGTEISLRAAPTSFWYEFGGWTGTQNRAGSQFQEALTSSISLKGEFSISVVSVSGVVIVVVGLLIAGLVLLRNRPRHRPPR